MRVLAYSLCGFNPPIPFWDGRSFWENDLNEDSILRNSKNARESFCNIKMIWI